MNSQRTYGRKVPPALPSSRMLSRVSPVLPVVVDLRPWCGPVKDQGAEGSCTAHAGTSAAELIYRKYRARTPVFSPAYTYAYELIEQGDFPRDSGSDGVTLCQTLINHGCCTATAAPYTAGQITKPLPEQDAVAATFRIVGAYHGLAGSQMVLTVLGNPTPWPALLGFTVKDSFEGDAVAATGVYAPGERESSLGGHEVLIVGYDVAPTPIIRPVGCPLAVLVQNSWGPGWGLQGFFWMPLYVLDDPESDMKVIHSGGPWK